MLRALKAIARGVLRAVGLYTWYTISTKGPLKESGWLRSFDEGEPVDDQGGPVPWMVYPAVEFLVPRLRPDMSVFEYGSGNSTLWWASRVRELVSCEHDPAWYEKVRAGVPANVTMLHVPLVPGGDYCRKVSEYREAFDIVIIDGRDRVNCAVHAMTALKPDGVILWDDTYRSEYQEGYDALARAGYRRIDFRGFAPVFNQYGQTGIFYRPGNCLGI